jgi:hypothetical protein
MLAKAKLWQGAIFLCGIATYSFDFFFYLSDAFNWLGKRFVYTVDVVEEGFFFAF